ncbi:MAG: hypothetical protein AB8H03_24980 [Saprospiraceae bacterium]
MEKIHCILLFGIITFLMSCQTEASKEEKSDKSKPSTFVNFYVRFLQKENQTEATATFQNGMTQQQAKPLKIEKGVFFHNGNMVERTIPKIGTRYQAFYDGPFSPTYKFQFQDPLKGKTDHIAQINQILDFSFEGEISKSKGAKLSWEGAPLNKNEALVFLIQDAKNKSRSFELKGKTDVSKIDIASKHLSQLELGAATIYLVRKQSKAEQKPNLVILAETEFYTLEKSILITP